MFWPALILAFSPGEKEWQPDAENDVMRACDPNRAVGLQNFLATFEPFEIEFVIEFRPTRFVPIAFVHFDHPPGVTTDATVGKEIRRVGKDAIKPAFGILHSDGIEQFKRVAVVNPQSARVIAELQRRRTFLVASFDGNRSIFAEFKMRGSKRIGMDKIAVSFFRRSCPIEWLWLTRRFGFRHARSIDQKWGADQVLIS